jgi:hypothetical protein
MDPTQKQFIGDREVKSSAELVKKHRDTIPLTEVEYVDGTKEIMPTKMFQVITRPAATDLTNLRYNRCEYPVKDILDILLSYGIRVDELQFVTTMLASSVNNSIKKASAKLWNKEDQDVDLLDVDNVLLDKVTVDDILKEGK